MAEVVWTEEALSDLNAIGEYYDRTSPQYASVIVDTLYTSVERLTEHSRWIDRCRRWSMSRSAS